MRYIAHITRVLQPGIHRVGGLEDGKLRVADMPLADRFEIECDQPGEPYFMFRYAATGELCGNTWHESLAQALSQAKFEYGLSEEDFVAIQGPA